MRNSPIAKTEAERRARAVASLSRPALAGLSFLVLMGAAAPASAQAVESDFMRNTMQMMGLIDEDKPDIDYRERAPLVVPQNAENLPAPRDSLAVANPNWPKDPDVARQKKAKEVDNKPIIREDHGRAIMPSELNKGRRVSSNTDTWAKEPVGTDPDHKQLMPSDLGAKSLFSKVTGKQDQLTFTGEPERESLIQPPTGYQTPSPNAPYGVVEEKQQTFKLPSLFQIQDSKENQSR